MMEGPNNAGITESEDPDYGHVEEWLNNEKDFNKIPRIYASLLWPLTKCYSTPARASSEKTANGDVNESPQQTPTEQPKISYMEASGLVESVVEVITSNSPTATSFDTVVDMVIYLKSFFGVLEDPHGMRANRLSEVCFGKTEVPDLSFKPFLLDSLEAIKRVVLSAVESVHDFEFMWQMCQSNNSHKLLQSDSAKRSIASAKQLSSEDIKLSAWKLSVLYRTCMIIFRKASPSRQETLLTFAASISLYSDLPVAASSADEKPTKKQKIAGEEQKTVETNPMAIEPSHQKEQEDEQDAIAALSMMMSTPHAPPSKDETNIASSTMELCLKAATELQTFIGTVAKGDSNFIASFDQAQIQEHILLLLRCLKYVGESDLTDAMFMNIPNSDPAKPHSPDEFIAEILSIMGSVSHLMSMTEKIETHIERVVGQMTTEALRERFLRLESPLMLTSSKRTLLCGLSKDACHSIHVAVVRVFGEEETRESQTHEVQNLCIDFAVELQDWCTSLLNEGEEISPNESLLALLKINKSDSQGGETWEAVVLPLLNQTIAKLAEEIEVEGVEKKHTQYIFSDMKLLLNCGSDLDRKMCRAVIVTYFYALEAIISHESERLGSVKISNLVVNDKFHQGIMACSYVCLLKAFGDSRKLELTHRHLELDVFGAMALLDCPPYNFLKVCETFRRAMKLKQQEGRAASEISDGLPNILHQYMCHCEVLILDSLIWSKEDWDDDCCIIDVINEMQSTSADGVTMCCWPPKILMPDLPQEILDSEKNEDKKWIGAHPQNTAKPDQDFVGYVMRKLLRTTYFRIHAICSALRIPQKYLIATHTWIAFRYLLRNKVDLLYDRHVDQLMLCALYGVCKIMRYEPELSFGKIIEAYTACRGEELGEKSCTRIVRHIRLVREQDSNGETDTKRKTHGNVIHLYNQVFVPSMKTHLLQSDSLKKAADRFSRSKMHDTVTIASSAQPDGIIVATQTVEV